VRFQNKYHVSIGLALVALTFGGSSVSAYAQAAPVACFLAPAKLSDSEIAAFLANPNTLLSDFPAAGLQMSSKVRGLTGSSSDTLDPMIALVRQANAPQKSAIGAGLARAAKSCQITTPDYALLIQQKVAAANDSDLTTAFAAGMNDVQTASLGAASTGSGAASGIGSGGTPGVSSGNKSTADTPTPTVTTPFNARVNRSFAVGTAAAQQTATSPAN
jgi:hypothetical protein